MKKDKSFKDIVIRYNNSNDIQFVVEYDKSNRLISEIGGGYGSYVLYKYYNDTDIICESIQIFDVSIDDSIYIQCIDYSDHYRIRNLYNENGELEQRTDIDPDKGCYEDYYSYEYDKNNKIIRSINLMELYRTEYHDYRDYLVTEIQYIDGRETYYRTTTYRKMD